MARTPRTETIAAPDDPQPDGVVPGRGLGADVNEPLRRPLTVLCLVVPVGLVAELYRFMSQQKAALLAEEQWAELGAVFGLDAPLVPSVTLAVGCLLVQVARRYAWALPAASTVLLVTLWAAIWAVVRYAVAFTSQSVSGRVTFAEDPVDRLTNLGQIGLAVSGAVQEELLFRAGLLGALVVVCHAVGLGRRGGYLLALPVSAAAFSLAHTEVVNHYPGAEPLTMGNFINRFIAGLLYGFIFLRQGLAVSTFAHAGYNLALVFRLGPWL